MSNHTQGPWRYEPSAAGTWTIYTDGLPGESGADETLIAYGIRVAADALILAAAPEMIAVLEELEQWSDPEGAFDADGMRSAVRAALAKVRGGGQQVVD